MTAVCLGESEHRNRTYVHHNGRTKTILKGWSQYGYQWTLVRCSWAGPALGTPQLLFYVLLLIFRLWLLHSRLVFVSHWCTPKCDCLIHACLIKLYQGGKGTLVRFNQTKNSRRESPLEKTDHGLLKGVDSSLVWMLSATVRGSIVFTHTYFPCWWL